MSMEHVHTLLHTTFPWEVAHVVAPTPRVQVCTTCRAPITGAPLPIHVPTLTKGTCNRCAMGEYITMHITSPLYHQVHAL